MTLVSAGGLLERTFTAGRFAMQLCAEAYSSWRFTNEALPINLIKRCQLCFALSTQLLVSSRLPARPGYRPE